MIWRGLLLVGLAVAAASASHAQTFGSCELGSAVRLIDTGALQMKLRNTGTLFEYPYGDSGASIARGYVVRDGRDRFPNAGVSLLLAGTVEGEPRGAMGYYSGFEFWPGPLDDAGSPPTDCAAYDRIYIVSRRDIERYYETGELTDDLRDWPHQLGAPVIDGDGDSTNYDLRAGDQPELIGDIAAWWVMNDAGNDHNPGAPLGVEVRVLAFAFGNETTAQSPALTQTTYYRYEILNRGHQTVDSMYAAMWSHFDLGDGSDDYIGSDTLRNLLYVYNDSNEDTAYGEAPPAFGIQVLSGPVGLVNGRDDDFDGLVDEADEQLRATATGPFIYECGVCDFHDPGTPNEFYYLMQGQWQNGEPIIEYGDGLEEYGRPEPITSFLFSGDPVTESFWSEMNIDGNGQRNGYRGYRRSSLATGPFRLEPGASATLLYAMPYARSTSHLQSIAALRAIASVLQDASSTGAFELASRVRAGEHGGLGVQDRPVSLSRVQPNPVSGPAVAFLTLPTEAHVRATILDALGRQLEVVVDSALPEGETELAMPAGLPPGMYVLRVEVPGAVETLTFTVAR